MFVELDGVRLSVNAPGLWRETPGVGPSSTFFEFDRGEAEELFRDAEMDKSILRFDVQGEERVIEQLTILGLGPTTNPNTQRLQLSDRRWTWNYPFVSKSYNVPRKSPQNSQRIVAKAKGFATLPVDIVRGLRIQTDDKVYAQWSLNKGSAWTAMQVLTDVMDLVAGPENWISKLGANVQLGEIENLVLKSQGATALSQVFAHVGGAVDVYVNREGIAVLFSPQDGGELAQIGLERGVTVTRSSGPRPIVGRPLRELQDNVMTRPSGFRILFDQLIENRIDFRESDDTKGITTVRGDPVVPMSAFNVFPCPEDGVVPAIGNRKAREVVKGTWLTLADLLAFYANAPKSNVLAGTLPLTEKIIEKLWFSNGLNAYAHPAYDKGKIWDRRIAVIREHWRRTYQIQRPWIDRVKDIQPYRVALEDAESGARSPALVFQDYSVVYAWDPNPTGELASDDEKKLVQTKVANPKTGVTGGKIIGTSIADLNNAPFDVRIKDNQQGIVQIVPQDDWTGFSDRYVRTATIPLQNPKGAFGNRKILLQDEAASAGHEVSIIMTFAMASPNNSRRFFAVDVANDDAVTLLPAASRIATLGKGPILEIKFGAPRLQARVAWDDSKALAFQQLFSGGFEGALPDIGDPVNLAQLRVVALSVAANEMARFVNRAEGSLTTAFNPDARVAGSISAVVHELVPGPGGGALTTIEMSPTVPGIDPKATMPADVRRVIDGFVER